MFGLILDAVTGPFSGDRIRFLGLQTYIWKEVISIGGGFKVLYGPV